MEQRKIRAFLLRLCPSIREEAEFLAKEEGVSLNHFISLALAERIARMETAAALPRDRRPLLGSSNPREGNRSFAVHASVSLPIAGKTLIQPLRAAGGQRRF